jgi:c-di-GMP-binding flagellar brake protein YcgR
MTISQDLYTSLDPEQLEFLTKLEEQIHQELKDLREFERMEICAGVALSPADSSRAMEPVIAGRTLNLSRGGCMVEVTTAPSVGDHYRVAIVGFRADPLFSFARCVRVVLKKDETFEAGFRFFSPIEIPVQNIDA